jgi:hypothetical protein
MEDQSIYTLAEANDEFMIMRGINKKKYFTQYMVIAKYVWRHLFKNTIYAVNSEWLTLKKGTPYNYVDVPKGMVRLFSACVTNHCNEIIPLFYDNSINIIQKPTSSQKKCGCNSCDCGGICEDIGSLTYTTKVLFTISGVDYIEKDWIKVCPNGDIIEYRIVPTKKYNNFTGDGGDYSDDYMNDYSIGAPPFADYTIEYIPFQSVICKLTVLPCGCPENTQENIDLLNTHCGCYLSFNAFCKKKQCKTFLGEINGYHNLGSIKISECGTKIYYIPHKTHDHKEPVLPMFLLLNWQSSGENCSEVVQVPEYAIECLWGGMDYYSKRYNNSFSPNEKLESKYNFRDLENQLIMFLNPLSLEWLSTVQDAVIKY